MKKNNLIHFLLYFIFTISIFSYEVNIHSNFYLYFEIVLVASSFLCFLSMLKYKNYKDLYSKKMFSNPVIFVLTFLMIISTIVSLLQPNEIFSTIFMVVAYIINIYFYFVLLPTYFKENIVFENKLFKYIVFLITLISLFGLVLYFKNGLLGYYLEGGRSGSIYFDPNFFAVVSLIACILSLKCDFSKKMKFLIFIVSILSIIASGSRGTMLSFFICIVYYVFVKFPNKNVFKKYSIIVLSSVALFCLYNYLNKIGFLRLYQGSNGRTELLKYSFSKIKESPFFGFGFGSISELMHSGGFRVTSSHNSLVDLMLRYGIPTFIVQIYIIAKAFFKNLSKKSDLTVSLLMIVLLVNMNTILYSFGGVGFPSMMLTISLGYNYFGGKYEN